ncbi:hypothetical protein KF707_02640, partial [Candidatus Obscuribacterales bacterium]|nr:hypothetical protein [Candidatus Obscuribacterales bacterium]
MPKWNKPLALGAALISFLQPSAAWADGRGQNRGQDWQAAHFLELHGMSRAERHLMRAEQRDARIEARMDRVPRSSVDASTMVRNLSRPVQPAFSLGMLPNNLNLKSMKNTINLKKFGLLEPVTITAGGKQIVIDGSSRLTAAEAVAVRQILTTG